MVQMEAGNLKLTVREFLLIIAALLGVGWGASQQIWGVAIWKDGVDQKLSVILDHQKEQDQKLQWLMDHNPDGNSRPMSAKPQSLNLLPNLIGEVHQQTAGTEFTPR